MSYSKDVTQPKQDMKAVDRGAHVEAYIDEMKQSEPLHTMHRTLRSRILETSGLHHNFWDNADWARRVRAKGAAHEAAKKGNK